MDQIGESIPSSAPLRKDTPRSLLSYVAIVLFEVGFVVIFLGGILLLLSYLHIISFQATFPFVARLTAIHITSSTSLSDIVFTDSTFTQGVLLKELLQRQINQAYIFQDNSQVRYSTFFKDSKQARWSIDNTAAAISITIDPKSQKMLGFTLNLSQDGNAFPSTITSSYADSTIRQYMLSIPARLVWKCENVGKISECSAEDNVQNESVSYSIGVRKLDSTLQLMISNNVQLN